MGLKHRVGKEFVVPFHCDVRDLGKLVDWFVLGDIPTGRLQPVRHALGAFDEKLGPPFCLVGGGAKAWESGRLEAVSLQRLERNSEERAGVLGESGKIEGHRFY